ncbi:MAG: DUF3667 domain-containing protein [Bacteroidales bacterium]|nr:DUF3667 domain-containing protein [Bacteroidales bacterium]
MKCLNCDTTYEGNFCPKCGQKASTARFLPKEMLLSVVTSLIGGDNKLFITCKGLLTRPGHMVREYLLGKRVSYYAPIPSLLFLVAVYAIVTYAMADTVSPFDLLKLKLDENDVATDSAQQFILVYRAITENKVYFALYSVLLSLLPYWLIFRRHKIARPDGSSEPLNVAEHFFTLVYQTCFNMLLAFALLPFSVVPGSEVWTTRLCLVMPTVYCIILYKQICSISWIRSTLLNLLCVVSTVLLSLVGLLLTFGLLYGYDYAK